MGSGVGANHVWVRLREVTLVSVYLSPNVSDREYERRVAALEDAIREMEGKVIVAGDFNARAVDWGMPTTNAKGSLLLEMAARLDLVVANEGRTATYRRPGYGSSIPDVTFVSAALAPRVYDWRVIEAETCSDHQHIVFSVGRAPRRGDERTGGSGRWNLKKLNVDSFVAKLREASDPSEAATGVPGGRLRTNRLSRELTKLLERICDEAMPRKGGGRKRPPAYWWTGEIADLRRQCVRARRKLTRERSEERRIPLREAYRTARKALIDAIKASKRRCWRELIEEVDRNPWGTGYQLVTGRLHGRSPPEVRDVDSMRRIVDGLFPTHETREETWGAGSLHEIRDFSLVELLAAVALLKPGKAPGPDGIPCEIIRLAVKNRPKIFLDLFNECLRTGTFCDDWKVARLVLIPKNKGGDPDSPSSYRPLSLLNTLGKLFELLLKPRLLESVRAAGDLSADQNGFREGHSTIGAIRRVVDFSREVKRIPIRRQPIVVLATLDVRNAFNSARWVDILKALQNDFGMPSYLMRVLDDYLRNRKLSYQTTAGTMERDLTAGVAQGSILGPLLWNILYDGLLRLEMPEGASLVAYADDVAVIIRARDSDEAQGILEEVMRRVNEWMGSHGLELALQKTEIVILTTKRVDTVVPMAAGGVEVGTSKEAKYLGVTLDNKLNYRSHIKKTSERAMTLVAALSRLMANVRGPGPDKRRLLMSTTHSIMLYGAEIWAPALERKSYRRMMARVQWKGALRIASAYRTVSEGAIMVIASVIPIDLLAGERMHVYDREPGVTREEAAAAERERTFECWQRRWEGDPEVARWTKRLIKNLRPWVEREWGEVNFYLTQFLSGHGYFRSYLDRRRIGRDPSCRSCGWERDDAEHTFFQCAHWESKRRELEAEVGAITPDNIVELMLQRREWWQLVATYVADILKAKRSDPGW